MKTVSRFAPQGKPDPGRREGAWLLMASRFKLIGPYNDDSTFSNPWRPEGNGRYD